MGTLFRFGFFQGLCARPTKYGGYFTLLTTITPIKRCSFAKTALAVKLSVYLQLPNYTQNSVLSQSNSTSVWTPTSEVCFGVTDLEPEQEHCLSVGPVVSTTFSMQSGMQCVLLKVRNTVRIYSKTLRNKQTKYVTSRERIM